MMVIYNIIIFIGIILYMPFLFIRRKWHALFPARLGFIPESWKKGLASQKNIWIHAVSVGEVSACEQLIVKLKELFPDYQIVCSTVTTTGYALAQKRLGKLCYTIYAPLDLSWVVRRYVALIRPQIYISAETEIWPNLYQVLNGKGTPIILINGRLSDGSFKNYKKIGWFIKSILNSVDCLCMQSALDAERVIALGALPKKVSVVGNLKFDNLSGKENYKKENLGYDPDDLILIAGSTHPGEEDILIDLFNEISMDIEQARLIIAPRHIERVETINHLIAKKGLRSRNLSTNTKETLTSRDVLLVDTIGQLNDLYAVATVVFVGKSLVGQGGQNMIEPVALRKPTIVGPHTYNFKDVVALLLQENALIQVKNKEELKQAILSFLKDSDKRKSVVSRTQAAIEKYKGATDKTVKRISDLIRTKNN